jgi:uncharacterized spore protein YtfJ
VDKGLRRVIDAVAGARLCYGDPVREGDRTIIPVTRVRVSGGWGFGRNARRPKEADGGGGGGGGGTLDAQPAGFIELGPEGARFHEIPDPDRAQRLLKTGAAAFTAVLAGVAGARGLGARRRVGGRRPAGLLGR